METLAPLLQAAVDLQNFCLARDWHFCFIGGLAIQRWGEPRFTKDADLTLLTGFGREEEYIQPLLDEYEARRPDALEFAVRARVLMLRHRGGITFDIALGALPFEQRAVSRAVPWPVEGSSLIICSAEDFVVHKAFANRDRDWVDLEGVLHRHGPELNVPQIFEELRPLIALKEEPEIEQRLQKLFDEHLR